MRTTSLRTSLFAIFAFSLFAACFVSLLKSGDVTLVKAQSDKELKQLNRSPSRNYGFTEEAPFGDWSAQSEMDTYQSDDPATPVVIAGITSYTGKGRWRKHLMIESVVLKNHFYKAVKSVQFGWIIITDLRSQSIQESRSGPCARVHYVFQRRTPTSQNEKTRRFVPRRC